MRRICASLVAGLMLAALSIPAQAAGYSAVKNASGSDNNIRGYLGYRCTGGSQAIRPGELVAGFNSFRAYGRVDNHFGYVGSKTYTIDYGVCKKNLDSSGSWWVRTYS